MGQRYRWASAGTISGVAYRAGTPTPTRESGVPPQLALGARGAAPSAWRTERMSLTTAGMSLGTRSAPMHSVRKPQALQLRIGPPIRASTHDPTDLWPYVIPRDHR